MKRPGWRYSSVLILSGCFIATHLAWAVENSIALSVRGKAIQAELALTEKARARGLMHRKTMCKNCGMLFVFPYADKWAFWSKNTPLPLSLAFVDEGGRIVQMTDMKPNSTKNHVAVYDVPYVLEMNKGWFSDNGIAEGDSINGLVAVKPAVIPSN